MLNAIYVTIITLFINVKTFFLISKLWFLRFMVVKLVFGSINTSVVELKRKKKNHYLDMVFEFPNLGLLYIHFIFLIFLHLSFSYSLFPLLLLLDAAVDCRSQQKDDTKENFMPDVQKMPHKVSDNVAEGVLQCLEELLKKCHLRSVDQVV